MSDDRLSDEELADLDTLTRLASPAPWRVFAGPGIGGPDFISLGTDDDQRDMYVKHDEAPAPTADLDLIAAARNAVPRLISEVCRNRPARRNALRASGKRPYLAVYDYGTGGIWIYVYAESAEQITERYPGLTVITEWRDWMTPERIIELTAGIGSHMTFDIDKPDGWLAQSDDELRRSR